MKAARSLDEWAEVIGADLTRAVDGILAAGRHLTEAKAEHPGTFGSWIASGVVGVGPRQAQRLMAIAKNLDGLDATRRVALPKDTLTLYTLVTNLTSRQLVAAIDAGTVHPALTRAEVKEVIAEANGLKPDELPEVFTLVQQRWTGRGYIPSPRGNKTTIPAPVRQRPTPPIHPKIVAIADLNLVRLGSGDEQAVLAEAEKLVAALRLNRES